MENNIQNYNNGNQINVNQINQQINDSILNRYMTPNVEEPNNTLNPRQCQLYNLCPSTLFCDKREVTDWKNGKYISQDDIPFESVINRDHESELLGLNNTNLAYCAPNNKNIESDSCTNASNEIPSDRIWNINTSPRANFKCESCQ
jgi:hypothetical protein